MPRSCYSEMGMYLPDRSTVCGRVDLGSQNWPPGKTGGLREGGGNMGGGRSVVRRESRFTKGAGGKGRGPHPYRECNRFRIETTIARRICI